MIKKANNWLDQYDEGGPTGKEKETKSTSQEDSVDKVNRIRAKLDQEQQRVKGVRANLIPSAQALDKADSELPMKDPNAYRIFEESKGARTPEELRKYISNYPQSLKNVLPVGGNYNIAQWQKDISDWDPQKYPGRELYCTPYGCFVYQKAGAKDVPNVGGNYGFVGGVEKGELPFREISPDKAQPGDMAIIYGDSPVDYTNPKKGRAIRPHHTSMYAGNMQKDSKGNIASFDMYNAHEGQRLNFKKEKRDKALDKDSFYKLYEYVGQTPQIEKELQEAYSELIRSNEMAPRQLNFPQDEPEVQPSSYLQSLPSQEYGGWLDEYQPGGRVMPSETTQSFIPAGLRYKMDQLKRQDPKQKQKLAEEKKYYENIAKAKEDARKQQVADRKARIADSIEAQKESVIGNPNWREVLARQTQATGDKFRVSDEPNFFDDYINPGVWIGDMASGLGQAPYAAKESNSNLPYALAIGAPLLTGALEGIGGKSAKDFITNIVSPVPFTGEMINKGLNKIGKTAKGLGKINKSKQPPSFDNIYEDYFYKLKLKEKELLPLVESKKISYKDYINQLDSYKGELNKQINLGEKLGSGNYGSVYKSIEDPSKVIKIGNPMSSGQVSAKNWTPELIENLKSIRQNANIAIPEQVEYLTIPSVYKGYSPSIKEVMRMPNLNEVSPANLNLNKRDRYALFLKQARQLRDKGIGLDVHNIHNFKFNKNKGVFDIYDINPMDISNPGAYMQFIKEKTRGPLFENMMYKQGGIAIKEQKLGGWLDELDEYRRGGQKGLRKFTSKNIQSSINRLFSRNYDLFGPSGKKYYSPLVKYFNGGFNQGNALPGATQSTDWSMMANPNAVDYRTQAYPNASNPTMMQGPAAPTVTNKLTPEMGFDYKQKFDNPLFGSGKLAGLARGLMPWATQLGMQDEYRAMEDKAFASTNANAVFRKDDQKNLGTHTMDTYGIDTMRPNQVGMKVFGQGLAYENQNIGRYGGQANWLDNY